jgi:hypothetical protein
MIRAPARLGTDLVWQIKCRHNPASIPLPTSHPAVNTADACSAAS